MYNREEAKQLRLDFWNGFGYYSRNLSHLKSQNNKWVLYHTKIKNLELKFELERFTARVILEINHRNENLRLDMFEQIQQYKTVVEETFGEALIWDYVYTLPTQKEVCRIYCEKDTFDFHKREHWPAIYQYLSAHMIKMEAAFYEIKDFIQPPSNDAF